MRRPAFFNLVDEIKNDSVFHNESNTLQTFPAIQLGVSLYRLGHSHQAIGEIACLFGIGEGTVQLFFTRITIALLHLRPKYLYWPKRDGTEHSVMRQKVEAKSQFPGCLGYLDGTLIGVRFRPKIETSTYWSGKKKKYGIGVQAICDQELIFRYVQIGFPGSVSDATAFAATDISLYSDEYLQPREYLLADKGYCCTTSAKKKVSSGVPRLPPDALRLFFPPSTS
jgi:hypothetical protein